MRLCYRRIAIALKRILINVGLLLHVHVLKYTIVDLHVGNQPWVVHMQSGFDTKILRKSSKIPKILIFRSLSNLKLGRSTQILQTNSTKRCENAHFFPSNV